MSHVKYLSSTPCGFEEEDFFSFHYMYKGIPMNTWGGVNFDPKAMI